MHNLTSTPAPPGDAIVEKFVAEAIVKDRNGTHEVTRHRSVGFRNAKLWLYRQRKLAQERWVAGSVRELVNGTDPGRTLWVMDD